MATLTSLTVNDTGNLTLPNGTSANRTSNSSTLVSSFTTVGSTTWTCPSNVTSIEVLVVAGGGAGGNGNGRAGGGGAGGAIYNTAYPVIAGTSYTVIVGAGATGTSTNAASPTQSGGNSQFDSLIAYGGGQGGNGPGSNTPSYVTGQNGGCGGGGGGTNSLHYTAPAGNGTLGQGYGGGNGVHLYGVWAGGGGGGGAGGAGFDSTISGNQNGSGNGGPGLLCYITGSPVYYGGGGGGTYFSGSTLHGRGGQGGGGNAGSTGSNASANTGGGGGSSASGGTAGGSGGSGIVIIRYTLDSANADPRGQTRYNTVTNTIESYGGNSAWKQTHTNDNIVANGLTLHLDAARYASGSTWTDLSRAGNNGTLTNTPTFNPANGGYFSFVSASSQYVAITDSDASFNFGANDYAVDAWIYPTSSQSTSNVILNQSDGGAASNSAFYFGFATDGVAHYVSDGTGWDYNASVGSKSYGGAWRHVVWTRRGDNLYAYVDGGLAAWSSLSNGFTVGNSTRDVQIGTQALGDYTDANIAVVRVYKGRSLSETEIRQNYNAQCTRFDREPIADKPPIVYDGSLVLYLDAGDRASFTDPGTQNQTIGNTMFWNDLSVQGNRCSIPYSNLPVFYPEYKGYLNLTNNTTISFPSNFSLSYPFTLSVWCAHNSSWNPGAGLADQWINLTIGGQRVSFVLSDNSASGWLKGPGVSYGGTNHWSTTYSGGGASGPNDFHNVTVVIYGSNNSNHQLYIDGVQYGMQNNAGAHGGTAGNAIGSNGSGSEFWDGKLAQVLIYNRPLTAMEVRQNFDAVRGRFGI